MQVPGQLRRQELRIAGWTAASNRHAASSLRFCFPAPSLEALTSGSLCLPPGAAELDGDRRNGERVPGRQLARPAIRRGAGGDAGVMPGDGAGT